MCLRHQVFFYRISCMMEMLWSTISNCCCVHLEVARLALCPTTCGPSNSQPVRSMLAGTSVVPATPSRFLPSELPSFVYVCRMCPSISDLSASWEQLCNSQTATLRTGWLCVGLEAGASWQQLVEHGCSWLWLLLERGCLKAPWVSRSKV